MPELHKLHRCRECGGMHGEHEDYCSVTEEAWAEFRLANVRAYAAEDIEWGYREE